MPVGDRFRSVPLWLWLDLDWSRRPSSIGTTRSALRRVSIGDEWISDHLIWILSGRGRSETLVLVLLSGQHWRSRLRGLVSRWMRSSTICLGLRLPWLLLMLLSLLLLRRRLPHPINVRMGSCS
jgi:hypothetical protein